MDTKTEEEIRAYSKVFWKRYTELPEFDRLIKNIERGEEMIRQKELSIELIDQKCHGKKYYDELDFNNNIYCKFKSRFYSTDHDKYLIFASYKYGYSNWKEVRLAIKREDSFEFDDYFKSRSESELNKRMASLLKVIKAELEYEEKKREYRKEEERTLARLSINGHFKNLTEGSNKALEEILEENGAGSSEVEEIDMVGFAQGPQLKKNLLKESSNSKAVAQKPTSEHAKSLLLFGKTPNLAKRKPETNGQKASDEIQPDAKPLSKQQTLSTYFSGSSKPLHN